MSPAEALTPGLPKVFMASEAASKLLSVSGLSKSFAAPVLIDFDLDVGPGEVHALVGANGAGKTTLARIVCGLLSPDSGSMQLDGVPHAPASKRDAEARGVHMVMQELNLIGTLSVAENVFLNRLPRRWGWIDYDGLVRATRRVLPAVGLANLDPMTPVGELGVGQQQLVEIAAALSQSCRLLILDEPTAALTDPQIDLLFENIRSLQQRGVGFIYISHRMEEIRRIADRVTVLRDGQRIATHDAAQVTVQQLVNQMAGRDLGEGVELERRHPGEIALRVRHLRRGRQVRDVSFDVRCGEILGLAGLIGSGRTETLRAVYGADSPDGGEVRRGPRGESLRIRSPADAVRSGIGMIPEDRKEHGLLLPRSVGVNATLARLDAFAGPAGWIDAEAEWLAARALCKKLDVQCRSVEQSTAELSGGNQQKVVIARWLLRDSDVLLFDEPTRGVDVASKWSIYRLLDELARSGKAIVMVSSELEELLALCDRIAVLSAGRLVATFQRGEWSQERIMAAAFSEHLKTGSPGKGSP